MQAAKADCDSASSVDEVRTIEANAAGRYWSGWNLTTWWKDREVPPHWRSFDQRVSHLSTSGRYATHPVNAMLNYGYAVLAGMLERAIVSRGLDPAMGHLHAPKDGRPSLVYDLMEPLRPQVDTQLLSWVQDEQWHKSDFVVDRTGVVRLHPELARVVVQKASVTEEAVGAVLDWYVGQLRAASGETSPRKRTRRAGVALGKPHRQIPQTVRKRNHTTGLFMHTAAERGQVEPGGKRHGTSAGRTAVRGPAEDGGAARAVWTEPDDCKEKGRCCVPTCTCTADCPTAGSVSAIPQKFHTYCKVHGPREKDRDMTCPSLSPLIGQTAGTSMCPAWSVGHGLISS